MKKNSIVLFLTGLMIAASLPAADKHQHMDPYVQGPASETGLIQEVRHKLVMLPRFGVFDDIGFTVNGGTVTLEGQVALPILKDDAEHAVKKIEGVTNVINNIEILPLSPNDNMIRRAAFRTIYGDPDIGARYGYSAVPSIHIIVKNGNLRLEGVVANEMDRNLIGIRANGIPGVFKVENDLRVEGK